MRNHRPPRTHVLAASAHPRSSFALILLLLCAPATGTRAQDAPRPNIVLLLVDDLRWDAIGFAGNDVVRTPRLDHLARSGVVFDNAFCTTSICYASRASILSGQYRRRHGIRDFSTPFSREAFAATFPALLRASGYRTAFVGKWGLGGTLPKEAYDVFDGFSGQGRYFEPGREEHLTRTLGTRALEFLATCSSETPFCLQLSFKATHVQDGDPWPFQPDPAYASLYSGVRVEPPPTASAAAFAALPDFLQRSEARRRWEGRFATPALFQKSVKDYYRLVAGVDETVGRILVRLEAAGLRDRTVIIFTSDNGFFLGEHGLAGKWFPHEESIRVPLLVADPREGASRSGARVAQMALNIDIAPTILELAGLVPPAGMQGESLVPLLRGEPRRWRREWFYEHLFAHPRIPRSEAVRGARWKYVRYFDLDRSEREGASSDRGHDEHEQLFDLAEDPREEHDLSRSSAHARQLARGRRRLAAWRERVRSGATLPGPGP